MTFKEAKDALKELAGNRYHCLEFMLFEYHTGELGAKCKCYIDSIGWGEGCATWEMALADIAATIHMKEHPEEIAPMIPEGTPEELVQMF